MLVSTITFTCDSCGDPIAGDVYQLDVSRFATTYTPRGRKPRPLDYHLCIGCGSRLKNLFFTNLPANVPLR